MTQPVLLSISMLAVFALALGGCRILFTRPAYRKQGVLMLIAALVLLANVLIGAWPR